MFGLLPFYILQLYNTKEAGLTSSCLLATGFGVVSIIMGL